MKCLAHLTMLLMLSMPALAATIHVPTQQPTIQAGINAASNGDVVVVAPGTYVENINFSGKAITVKSSNGAKVTFIDGNNAASVVTFESAEGLSSVLKGFTLENGSTTQQGGGIFIYNSSPTIIDNVVTQNTAAAGGGGIEAEFSSALIEGNTISNNSQVLGYSGGSGGGIEISGAGSTQFIGNTVENNNWTSAEGGGIALFAAGTPTLENNIIRGNAAYDEGGGLYIVNASNALIVQNLIYGNTASQGSGIYFLVPYSYAGPVLVNNTVVGTSSSSEGSAVYASGYDDQVTFYNNLLIGASGTNGLYCDPTYENNSPTLTNNDAYSASGTGIEGSCSGQAGESGNLSVDPMFRSTSNFRVKAGSLIRGAGDVSAPDLPAQDLSKGPRIVNGKIDMGVYEYPD
jgi:parallel beta-helix repeat protein